MDGDVEPPNNEKENQIQTHLFGNIRFIVEVKS